MSLPAASAKLDPQFRIVTDLKKKPQRSQSSQSSQRRKRGKRDWGLPLIKNIGIFLPFSVVSVSSVVIFLSVGQV
jgi:hypothetical protein